MFFTYFSHFPYQDTNEKSIYFKVLKIKQQFLSDHETGKIADQQQYKSLREVSE